MLQLKTLQSFQQQTLKQTDSSCRFCHRENPQKYRLKEIKITKYQALRS